MTKLLLITGPESSATRLFTSILSQHPQVLGTPDPMGHDDLLDEVWAKLEAGSIKRALTSLPDTEGYEYLLTRRVIPHGWFGAAAHPQDLPNFWALQKVCERAGMELILLITTRSTAANLASWTKARRSPRGDLVIAQLMYQGAYRHLFRFLIFNIHTIRFFFLSLEALLLDQDLYIRSLFQLLGISPCPTEVDLDFEVNHKRYDWYDENGKPMGPADQYIPFESEDDQ